MVQLLLRYLGQLILPALAIGLWRLEKRSVLDLGLRTRGRWLRNGMLGLVIGLQGVSFQIDHRGPIWWAGSARWARESGVVGLLFGVLFVVTAWWAAGLGGVR